MFQTKQFNNFSITNILISLCIWVSILFFTKWLLIEYALNPIFLEAKAYKEIVISSFVASFLHANIVHLLSNGFMLFMFGNGLEENIWKLKYLALFLLSSIFNWFFVVYFEDIWTVTVWISGFIMTVTAYYAYELFTRNDPRYMMFVQYAIIGVLIWFMPFVSLYGHLAGLISWVIIFAILNPKKVF